MHTGFQPFYKGEELLDFLFASRKNETFSNHVYSEREEFAAMGANSFL